MSLRTGHGGSAAHAAVVEPRPADELPEPVPVPVASASGPVRRSSRGSFADPESAREAGRRGGLAKARRIRLVDSLGLRRIADDAAFRPYQVAAEEFVEHHLGDLAKQAGGQVGAAPASMVASAALQLAASRFCFDKGAETGDVAWMTSGSKFADASRQNLLAAYELAVREAKVRLETPGARAPWLTAGGDEKP